jgi:hypothetical protein
MPAFGGIILLQGILPKTKNPFMGVTILMKEQVHCRI